MLRCAQCGGKLHTHSNARGVARAYCYTRDTLQNCRQRSVEVRVLEEQVERHLGSLAIPDDYQEIVLRALAEERPEVRAQEGGRRVLDSSSAIL